ncbi:hypothetical protein [Streptomyces sp. NPDC001876]|uniref:hypothetical protein n=1 Tax=Streptomyces sp. NPDC001876 TaxID=3154402 RepID=UPI00332602B7
MLVHLSSLEGGAVLVLHHFSERSVTASVEAPGLRGGRLLTDVFTGDTLKSAAAGLVDVALDPYGFRWLRVNTPLDDPDRATAV